MLCYRDKTFCDGAGCQKFNECPRAATREVIEASDRSGLMLARYAKPAKLLCYVPPNPSDGDDRRCRGTGNEWCGFSVTEGNRYKKCTKCQGSGKSNV